jgi:hypothetical protein
MNVKKTKKQQRAVQAKWNVFERQNYVIFAIGVGVIILGYLAMMQGPHDSFLSLRLSPILLVVGYCVLIPIAILKRPRSPKGEQPKAE